MRRLTGQAAALPRDVTDPIAEELDTHLVQAGFNSADLLLERLNVGSGSREGHLEVRHAVFEFRKDFFGCRYRL